VACRTAREHNIQGSDVLTWGAVFCVLGFLVTTFLETAAFLLRAGADGPIAGPFIIWFKEGASEPDLTDGHGG